MSSRWEGLAKRLTVAIVGVALSFSLATGALAGSAHITSQIKHGTTGSSSNGDVWAFARVYSGSSMRYATVAVATGDSRSVRKLTRCYTSCWRIDAHHEISNISECRFQVYAYAYDRLYGHYRNAC